MVTCQRYTFFSSHAQFHALLPFCSLGTTAIKPLRPDPVDADTVFEVQTFYETMFLKMGLPITYLAFRLDRASLPAGAPFAYPTDFDAAYWCEAEGPRRSFSHQPSKGSSQGY